MLKISKLFFLAAGSVVLTRAGCDVRRCNIRKCDILHKELPTCAGAVMDNYGIFFLLHRNLIFLNILGSNRFRQKCQNFLRRFYCCTLHMKTLNFIKNWDFINLYLKVVNKMFVKVHAQKNPSSKSFCKQWLSSFNNPSKTTVTIEHFHFEVRSLCGILGRLYKGFH